MGDNIHDTVLALVAGARTEKRAGADNAPKAEEIPLEKAAEFSVLLRQLAEEDGQEVKSSGDLREKLASLSVPVEPEDRLKAVLKGRIHKLAELGAHGKDPDTASLQTGTKKPESGDDDLRARLLHIVSSQEEEVRA